MSNVHHEGRHGPPGPHDPISHAVHDPAAFRDRFRVSLVLTLPVVAFSRDVQSWLGYTLPSVPGSALVAPVVGTAVFAYGGRVFVTGAGAELRARQPGMMTLITLAIGVAFVASWSSTLGLLDVDVWWELASLITIMLLGHWLEMRAIREAGGALEALASILPDDAERIRPDGSIETIRRDDVAVGDLVLVRPGGRIPADGRVEDGRADVDESMLTGESRSIEKADGASVTGGTVVQAGSLRVRVTAVGEATALAGIVRLVSEAQASRSRAQALADRAAAVLFYLALGSGAVTLVAWLALGRPADALERTATVLVIACPHALGLAIPLVVAITTTLGARNGLLVRNRIALEEARLVDVVAFDKTGTLTFGRPTVAAVAPLDRTEDDILAVAAAVEADSEHPLGHAIVAAAGGRRIRIPRSEAFEQLAGRGARARVDGRSIAIGGPALLAETGLERPAALVPAAADWEAAGRTVLWVIEDGHVVGALALEDEVRPQSAGAVAALRRLGVRVAMITGDSRPVAESVARRLGIDEVRAEVLPADKAAVVNALALDGARVAMVGDGVNDAPALATADVGIAIGAGTDVAVQSADLVLVSDDPRDVVGAIGLSRAAYRKMLQNLAWATGYNALAIPVAAGVLAPWGVELPMSVGALAMSLSTVVVALNALLLRRLRLRPAA